MDLKLEGKTAIVTGGSRGIGKAIARELAREGVDVAIAARNMDALEATARELAEETGRRIVSAAGRHRRRSGREPHGRTGGGGAGSHRHPGQQRGATWRTGRAPDAGADYRRDVLGGRERQGPRLSEVRPGCRAAHEGAGLGPHRQHQRHGGQVYGLDHRQHEKRVGLGDVQEPRRRAGPPRHQRDRRPSGPYPHGGHPGRG